MSRSEALPKLTERVAALRSRAKRHLLRARSSAAAFGAGCAMHAAVIATTSALVGGWLLVTYGLTALARPRLVWPISIGLLLISLGGIQQLGRTAWYGLYTLTRDE